MHQILQDLYDMQLHLLWSVRAKYIMNLSFWISTHRHWVSGQHSGVQFLVENPAKSKSVFGNHKQAVGNREWCRNIKKIKLFVPSLLIHWIIKRVSLVRPTSWRKWKCQLQLITRIRWHWFQIWKTNRALLSTGSEKYYIVSPVGEEPRLLDVCN